MKRLEEENQTVSTYINIDERRLTDQP